MKANKSDTEKNESKSKKLNLNNFKNHRRMRKVQNGEVKFSIFNMNKRIYENLGKFQITFCVALPCIEINSRWKHECMFIVQCLEQFEITMKICLFLSREIRIAKFVKFLESHMKC
jgi:hypothetical protein